MIQINSTKPLITAILSLLIWTANLYSQPGTNDASFNTFDNGLYGDGSGANFFVHATALQDDGKILIGGQFTFYNGSQRNRIIRLNSDGSEDATFVIGSGFNNTVETIVLLENGKILVGGQFTAYNGSTRNRIARLNSDGSLDVTFNPIGGCNNTVLAIAVQEDEKIVIGGEFTIANGTTVNRIARLNSDGSLDNTFATGIGFPGTSPSITSICISADGGIIIGGNFTLFNSITSNRIIKLLPSGEHDTTFNIGTGFNAMVTALAVQPDGKIVAVGSFGFFNGSTRNRMARLNANGSVDGTFVVGAGFPNLSPPNTISLQPDGKIIAGGSFTSFNNVDVNKIVRINENGSIDLSFDSGTGFNATVLSISLQPDGKIILGGQFSSYDGYLTNYLYRINANGSKDDLFNPGTGFNDYVNSTAIQTDGKIIVGGNFTSFNGSIANKIVRLNQDGNTDVSFTTNDGFNDLVSSVAIQNDGKVLTAGTFTTYNNLPANYLARLNSTGDLDQFFNQGIGFNNFVLSVCVQQDQKIIAGGWFTSFAGVERNSIARLNEDGSNDASFNIGTGFNNGVWTIAVQPDGKILVGGNFTTFNGAPINRIARLNTDGTLDSSFDPGLGFNDWVRAIAIQDDGNIIVAGQFTSFNGVNANRLVRLNINGTIDPNFSVGTGFNSNVRTVNIQTDGKIVVGGTFTEYNGVSRNYITRLFQDGSLDTDFDIESGFSFHVYNTSIQADGKIIAGGFFTSFNGIVRNRIARLNTCSPPSEPTGAETQSFCNSATIADLVVSGSSIQWYTTSSGGEALLPEYNLANNLSYFASQSIDGCESTERLEVFVNVNVVESPTGLTTQEFCNNALLSDLIVEGENIQWYYEPINGVVLNPEINLLNNTSYFASQEIEGCQSLERLEVLVSIINVPVATITQNGEILVADQNDFNYQWIDCENNYVSIANETNQTFTMTTNGNYAVIISEGICSDTSSCISISNLSITDWTQNTISLFPNPAKDCIHVSFNQAGILDIFSVDGRRIETLNVEQSATILTVEAYSQGMYTLVFSGIDGTQTHLVFIKE